MDDRSPSPDGPAQEAAIAFANTLNEFAVIGPARKCASANYCEFATANFHRQGKALQACVASIMDYFAFSCRAIMGRAAEWIAQGQVLGRRLKRLTD